MSLIGPSRAGKTMVFNVITGIYRPDEGEVVFEGRKISGMKPHAIAALGIGRTFQTLRLFGTLSCLENVMAARHSRSRAGVLASILRTPAQWREKEAVYTEAERRLRQVGLWEQRHALARNPAHRIVQMGIAHSPEGRQMFPTLTVEENLILGGFVHRKRPDVQAEIMAEVFELFPRLEERRRQLAGRAGFGRSWSTSATRLRHHPFWTTLSHSGRFTMRPQGGHRKNNTSGG